MAQVDNPRGEPKACNHLMIYHVRPPSMAARTLSAEDEQFVQHLTLTDDQTVAATQQAYTAVIRRPSARTRLSLC
eukprot:4132539-Pleurochrysis_carterae.AAC.1